MWIGRAAQSTRSGESCGHGRKADVGMGPDIDAGAGREIGGRGIGDTAELFQQYLALQSFQSEGGQEPPA